MTEIFVGIEWTSGTKAEAVTAAQEIVRREGYECGGFSEVDAVEERAIVGNLEAEERLYDDAEEDGEWEATDGVVTVRFETA